MGLAWSPKLTLRREGMTSADAFIRTILEQPDGDAPRLVYADWLEERGDPLAELIRVQCSLARLEVGQPRWESLRNRERQLLADHQPRWLEPIRRAGVAGRVRRGLPDINVTGTEQLVAGGHLFELPWVLHVNLSDGAAEVDDLALLARTPCCARIQELDLSRSYIGNDGLLQLCGTAFRCRPTVLMLNQMKVSTSGLR